MFLFQCAKIHNYQKINKERKKKSLFLGMFHISLSPSYLYHLSPCFSPKTIPYQCRFAILAERLCGCMMLESLYHGLSPW